MPLGPCTSTPPTPSPTDEDTRVVVAQQPDEFTNTKVEDAINWEIADLQGNCAMATARIVGKIVYHTEM